jgi:glycosyltransferase involved in cell wall biosynthesis
MMQTQEMTFINSPKPHILMLTTHGVHQWKVVPGLTDTGGQNVFVNQFSQELVHQGYKVTIINRGGYPHPVTGKPQIGCVYKDSYQRIIYLEDGLPQFVRKEDMGDRVFQLASNLKTIIKNENMVFDLIISHYWDAAVVGELIREGNHLQSPHVWVPHSLGAIKKKNVAESEWPSLRIDERIQNEQKILSTVDYVASTSPLISESLRQDYSYQGPTLWLPPCVSTLRYHPHPVPPNAPVWSMLSQASGLPVDEIQQMKIITEISRTDTTKRKDILLRAFAQLRKSHPDTFLVITINNNNHPTGAELMQLMSDLNIRQNTAVLGSVWDHLPDIYALSHIYCTPSIMEGFGMSAQEAAATGLPVVSSSLVPFAVQYLYGGAELSVPDPIAVGQGAVIVQPDDVEGFAQALDLLLSDERMRQVMGRKAYQITIPQFTWPNMVEQFLKSLSNR